MQFFVRPLHPLYHRDTQALILAAAPERSECVETWSQNSTEVDGVGVVRRDYVALDANDPHQVIGYARIWPQGEGRFRMDLIVAPAWRRRGVGSALLQTLLEALRAQNAMIVQARTPDHRLEALTFLMQRGFTETNRMIHLRLSVAHASTSALPPLTAHLAAQGVTVVTLDQEQAQNADWLPKIQALIRTSTTERVGNPYRIGSETQFCSEEDAARTWELYRPLSAEAFFLARTRERYVGLSFLSMGGGMRQVVQGDTAVHIDWRRMGIATLLKLHTIAYAQQNGYDEITTATASPGMLTLNQRLGFQQEWSEVRLVREIKNE